jgi:hypothetical protein
MLPSAEHQAENWWLEVTTDEPYLYLFGPFSSAEEAQTESDRYLADLRHEGWQVTGVHTTYRGPLFAPSAV